MGHSHCPGRRPRLITSTQNSIRICVCAAWTPPYNPMPTIFYLSLYLSRCRGSVNTPQETFFFTSYVAIMLLLLPVLLARNYSGLATGGRAWSVRSDQPNIREWRIHRDHRRHSRRLRRRLLHGPVDHTEGQGQQGQSGGPREGSDILGCQRISRIRYDSRLLLLCQHFWYIRLRLIWTKGRWKKYWCHKWVLKACLHIPTQSPSPSQCLSKFTTVPMVDGQDGLEPILPVILPVTIEIMLNFYRHCDGDGDGVGTCKQAFREFSAVSILKACLHIPCPCPSPCPSPSKFIIVLMVTIGDGYFDGRNGCSTHCEILTVTDTESGSETDLRVHLHWAKANVKATFFLDLCRCWMCSASWIS